MSSWDSAPADPVDVGYRRVCVHLLCYKLINTNFWILRKSRTYNIRRKIPLERVERIKMVAVKWICNLDLPFPRLRRRNRDRWTSPNGSWEIVTISWHNSPVPVRNSEIFSSIYVLLSVLTGKSGSYTLYNTIEHLLIQGKIWTMPRSEKDWWVSTVAFPFSSRIAFHSTPSAIRAPMNTCNPVKWYVLGLRLLLESIESENEQCPLLRVVLLQIVDFKPEGQRA